MFKTVHKKTIAIAMPPAKKHQRITFALFDALNEKARTANAKPPKIKAPNNVP